MSCSDQPASCIPLTDVTDSGIDTSAVAPVPNIDDIVLVASGKGGVGKSTVTVNLAASLSQQGLKVGILDADLYGPSIARMLGIGDGLASDESGLAVPAQHHGIAALSVASVMPPEAALVWKGPLVSQTLTQMFRDVAWPELDILLVDLPPGTGDVQLTILEQIPITGAVVVTTPQKLAVTDARRAVSLFHELDIPVFGLVENMTGYVCPCCGETQRLYPGGAAKKLAAERSISHLGSLPLDPVAQALADSGTPLVLGAPESATATAFADLAAKVRDAISKERAYRAYMAREGQAANGQAVQLWEKLLDE
ncbi:Mrp/NBP35 family ATP-binding protein [Aestuariirhabdus litorea]|uniref:Iron-sulfur cluster carrier protein n=1 Tax=Aestuariirhabdus litorea TaxID=2528527 RepID=A0A3P3VLR6_9GAMM|nr:Mrp/NBP35 family ATP-binding protein [Aestuariirhabdus litorea]RRJ82818.1 ATP-binding protein [Aestuariirhabdus litorea]RWW92977.1 ATP-binding protein [Endozoicomonadaceae bacterium GTF-13]